LSTARIYLTDGTCLTESDRSSRCPVIHWRYDEETAVDRRLNAAIASRDRSNVFSPTLSPQSWQQTAGDRATTTTLENEAKALLSLNPGYAPIQRQLLPERLTLAPLLLQSHSCAAGGAENRRFCAVHFRLPTLTIRMTTTRIRAPTNHGSPFSTRNHQNQSRPWYATVYACRIRCQTTSLARCDLSRPLHLLP
jgi:hypothetical protein